MEEQISSVQQLVNTLIEFCVNYSFQVVGAILVLVVGMIAGNIAGKIFFNFSQKKKWDVTLSKFVSSVIKLIILVFAVIIALGKFGITITPFVAALGAVAFGATMALQGPISNYGAGLSIIISRPFVVGDTISVVGVSGVVDDVNLGRTALVDEDGVKINIPNKHIVGEIISNSKANKIVEAVVGVSYDSDPEKAIAVIRRVLSGFQEVTQKPMPQIGIQAFADSSINIGYRYWVPTVKFFQISYAVNLAVFKGLQENQIAIPFPQREVRILSQPNAMKV